MLEKSLRELLDCHQKENAPGRDRNGPIPEGQSPPSPPNQTGQERKRSHQNEMPQFVSGGHGIEEAPKTPSLSRIGEIDNPDNKSSEAKRKQDNDLAET